jgi:site-specific DNA recombinase
VRLKGRVTNSTPSPLTGKLFDESGERLTPSHATKGERRYRYYISRGLMKDASERTRGWRLAASEIERIVAASARQILDDQKTILDAVQDLQIAPNQIPSILQDASAWSRRLESETERSATVETLVDRVELRQDGIRLSLKLPVPSASQKRPSDSTNLFVTRFIAMQIKRCGVETRLVIDGTGGSAPKTDPTLLKAVAHAHQWFDDLVSRRAKSMIEIAKREKVSKNYVGRLIRLAFLAPEVVDVILEGRQSPDFTVQALMTGRAELPLD